VQAALEIRQLKETVAGGEGRIKELVQQVSLELLLRAWQLIASVSHWHARGSVGFAAQRQFWGVVSYK
jgi:hypothetical protein